MIPRYFLDMRLKVEQWKPFHYGQGRSKK
jgi:hypothetical protein